MSELAPVHVFTKGIFKENPVFTLMLGLCPSLAVSNKAFNGFAMGFAVIFVLLGSNIIISVLRKFISDKIRIPAYIVIIATFVTIVDYVLHAYASQLHANLGIFIQLIVVNCIILGRAEAFANKNTIGDSILDALGMGIGFTLSLTVISIIRELLGAGSITYLVTDKEYALSLIDVIPTLQPAVIFILPAGAFFTIGVLMAFLNYLKQSKKGTPVYTRAHR